MPKILDYLVLSQTAISIKDLYTQPTDFIKNYNAISYKEEDAFLKHYLINNTAFIFKNQPLLYEQILKYIADELDVNDDEVKLIGSAKTGFSISPPPKYGNPFHNSDLDFTIISESLFGRLNMEFDGLVKLDNGEENYLNLTPKNNEYWKENTQSISRTLKRGFVDTHKLPYISRTPIASHIAEILARLRIKLKEIYLLETKQSSMRVYRDWYSFIKVLKYNTKIVLNEVLNQPI